VGGGGAGGAGAPPAAAGRGGAGGPAGARALTQGGFCREEYVRLLEQALGGLGYTEVAEALERASGIPLQSSTARDFRQALLAGKWERCLGFLPRLGIADEDVRAEVTFEVLREKYLELLEAGDVDRALACLRQELKPLRVNSGKIRALATLVVCAGPAQLQARAEWAGAAGGARHQLLRRLESLVPPAVMVPEGRLETLLQQAIEHQKSLCTFHNTTETTYSLLSDHRCGPEQIPSRTVQVLDAHTDEVWHVQWSPDGARLATASADHTAIIWRWAGEETDAADVGASPTERNLLGEGAEGRGGQSAHRQLEILYRLEGHKKEIAFLAWSVDSKRLATCSNDHNVRIWDAASGKLLSVCERHEQPVTSCSWLPDGKHLVSGGLDKAMYMWDSENGQEVAAFKGSGARINDIAVSKCGGWVFSSSNEKKFRVHALQGRRLKKDHEFVESESILSICLSACNRYLLVNLQNQNIHLWDFSQINEGEFPVTPMSRFSGQLERQGRYVVRSCFGGSDFSFVVSGSEDSKVYIWKRSNERLLKVLPGHSGTVNAVSWNRRWPFVFASASDDHSVRIWGR